MLFEDFSSMKLIDLEGDYITRIMFLNFLMGKSQTSVVVVGSTSGSLRIYEPLQGQLILANCFVASKIVGISAKMAMSKEEYDSLSILHENGTLVVVDANSIWMNIKMMNAEGGLFSFDPIPLAFKSFQLQPSKRFDFTPPSFQDCNLIAAGFFFRSLPLEFNLLLTEPIYPKVSPKAYEVLLLGNPFLQVFRIDLLKKEGENTVTSAAETVVKNVFSIGLKLWQDPKQVSLGRLIEPPKVESFMKFDESIRNARFGLPSPEWYNSKLVVISDTLGRLLLYSQPHNALTYMWKGMRNVDIGWLNSSSDDTLLLIVYHPRGHIEIFSIPSHNRIAASAAEKGGKLIRSDGGIVGAIHTQKKNLHSASCCLLLPDFTVYKVMVDLEINI